MCLGFGVMGSLGQASQNLPRQKMLEEKFLNSVESGHVLYCAWTRLQVAELQTQERQAMCKHL